MTILSIVFITAICVAAALVILWLLLRKFYHKASREMAFVRTGFGGQKVVMSTGALVIPALHEIIPVNMNTLRLEVVRANNQALITRDRMRVDVQVEFYVHVMATIEAVADAAQTLGRRTMDAERLKDLIEGRFVDALRAIVAEMDMDQLHEQRVDFVGTVKTALTEDLLKNGLELESVSLVELDQTDQSYFNAQNAFDALGLTALTEVIQARMRRRNEVERDTEVAIQRKNLEAERHKLDLSKEEEFARLEQQREIEVRRAEQQTNIAKEQVEKEQQAKEAQIAAKQRVDQVQIQAEKALEEERIARDLFIKEKDIAREKEIETAEIERQKTLTLAEQDRAIAIADKSKDQSLSEAEADKARLLAAKAEEQVTTTRQIEIAERQKALELVEARKKAEREAINITKGAEARKKAAIDQAETVRIISDGEADKVKKSAEAETEAELARAKAVAKRYAVDAEGTRALNEAENILDPAKSASRIKMTIIEHLSEIIRESVKPMEAIEGIKIVHVGGLHPDARGGAGVQGEGEAATGAAANLADQLVNSALRYRGQAPLVDAVLKEVGITSGDINGLTAPVRPDKETTTEDE